MTAAAAEPSREARRNTVESAEMSKGETIEIELLEISADAHIGSYAKLRINGHPIEINNCSDMGKVFTMRLKDGQVRVKP
jgi:hypothetical protein